MPMAGTTAWSWATQSPAADVGLTRRRKFVDAQKTHLAIAAVVVGIIKRLYAVEDRGGEVDTDEHRLALRWRIGSDPAARGTKEDKLFGWRDQIAAQAPDG